MLFRSELDGVALRAAIAAERAAEKSLTLTREQLELGQVSALQLLNAQQVYLTALINVVLAKANRYADTIALFQALGGGWWNRSDVDADEVRTVGSHPHCGEGRLKEKASGV